MRVNSPRRRLLVPCALTAAMLVVLCGLGSWQVRRLAWKNAVLAHIAQAEANAPVPLAGATPAQFTKIQVSGHWRADALAHYGAALGGNLNNPVMGADALQVLDRDDGPAVLVDRGWVPTDPAPLPDRGAASVTGYVRAREISGFLSAPDDVPGRHFYALDAVKIGAAVGGAPVVPFTVVAVGPPPVCAIGRSCPVPVENLPRPANNHLQYAITWYGLALTLLCVFGVWLRGEFRARPPA